MTVDAWLSGPRGQALAVAIAIVTVALIWFGVVDPARSWFSDREALLGRRQEMLAHMSHLAATLPALQAVSSNKHDDGAKAATILLAGDSDTVAAADLQERVQKMATDAGASLTAVETLPPAPPATPWHKIALRISLNASWPVLMELLRSVEQSPTRILIDDIHFRSPVAVARPAAVPIQASLVLYGFRPANSGAGM
jgi:general secretion pathway protein M